MLLFNTLISYNVFLYYIISSKPPLSSGQETSAYKAAPTLVIMRQRLYVITSLIKAKWTPRYAVPLIYIKGIWRISEIRLRNKKHHWSINILWWKETYAHWELICLSHFILIPMEKIFLNWVYASLSRTPFFLFKDAITRKRQHRSWRSMFIGTLLSITFLLPLPYKESKVIMAS